MNDYLILLFAFLATWRLSFLLAYDSAPGFSLTRLRQRCKASKYACWREIERGLSCTSCNSVWLGMIVSISLGGTMKMVVLRGLALSGFTLIVEAWRKERVAKEKLNAELKLMYEETKNSYHKRDAA